MTLSIDGRLDNSQGGLIAATQTLSLNRTSSVIDNSGGQLNGQRLEIDGKQLNNQNGQVTSQGALRVTLLGALLNTQGARLASGGDLLLNSANLDNRGGRLVSQALLRIDADSLNNSAGGTLASQQNLVLRLKGDLLNQQDGLVFSERGSLDIRPRPSTTRRRASRPRAISCCAWATTCAIRAGAWTAWPATSISTAPT